jgi:hypothetical protein
MPSKKSNFKSIWWLLTLAGVVVSHSQVNVLDYYWDNPAPSRHSLCISPEFFNMTQAVKIEFIPKKYAASFGLNENNYEQTKQTYQQKMQMMEKHIRHVLPQVSAGTTDILSAVLTNPNFTIYLAPETIMKVDGLSVAHPREPSIILTINEFVGDGILEVLNNEFHHQCVLKTNQLMLKDIDYSNKFKDPLQLTKPFLTHTGGVDAEKKAKLKSSITNDIKFKFDQFIQAYEHPNQRRPDQKVLLENVKNEVEKTYIPYIYQKSFTLKKFDQEFSRTDNPNKLYYKNAALNIRIVSEKTTSAGIALKYTYALNNTPNEKLKAFVMDSKNFLSDHFDKNSKYAQQSSDVQLAELASSIETFPPTLKKMLFPNFCAYMKNYMPSSTDTEYCANGLVTSCTPPGLSF